MKFLLKSKEWRKKISIALISAMIVSLMAPVLAWAAMQVSFTYDAESGIISGSVYVQDPNSVTLNVYTEEGSVFPGSYDNLVVTDYYDDENNQYSSVTYEVYVGGEVPTNVKIDDGHEVINLNNLGTYGIDGSHTVTLDVYRMQGSLLLSNLNEGSYIAAGSDLFNFTPNIGGADVVEFILPHNYFSKGTLNSLTANDFVIENLTTVGQAVYVDQLVTGSYWPSSYSNYIVRLQLDDNLNAEDQYKVSLGSSAINKIQLPTIVSNDNNFTSVVTTGSMTVIGSTYYYDKTNSVYFNNLQLTTASNNTGGGYYPPANSDKETVNEPSLKNGKDGKVAIAIANGTKQVLLPANAAKVLGENSLELKHEKYTLEIPSEVLAALAGLVSEEDLVGANISFTAEVVADQVSLVGNINSKGELKSAKVKSAGEAIDFTLSLITKDGKEHKLEKFSKALKLKLKLSADANAKLAGIYFIGQDSNVEFVGGKVTDGEVSGNVTHFSTYAALEYDKTFDDVKSSFWASDVIKNMSAKHVIAGVTDSQFVPNQDVTRAQFAAFLVRALELKASGASTFTDVATGKWYAAEIAAAVEAGIVSGRSAKIFAPEDVISREEMAIMIVRAHEYMTGKKVAASKESAFADAAKISTWAQAYVDAAYELGYIQGRGNNLFAPAGQATRAESAQVVSLLVK